MIRTYPVKSPTTALSTGSVLYQHLLDNIRIPARATHEMWYKAQAEKLSLPFGYSFRGKIPTGETMELVALSGVPFKNQKAVAYTFTGNEAYVLVSDLSVATFQELNIPNNAAPKEKVFNSSFVPYDELPLYTRFSNELAGLSVVKSLSSFFGRCGKVNYSEKDILLFIDAVFKDLGSVEATYVLHGNHLAWSALAYIRAEGKVEGDIRTEFYAQNTSDFYEKDLGSALPMLYYILAMLGKNPLDYHDMLDVEIYASKEAAIYMQEFMPGNRKGISDKPS